MDHVVLSVNGAVVYDSAPVSNNPFVAWKAQGFDLVQVQMWKLQRGMTEEEWAQAIAAGYSRQAPDSGVVVAVDLSGSFLEYDKIRGLPIPVVGSRSFTVNGAPQASRVVVVQASGQQAGPVTLAVNGAENKQPNLQGSCEVDAAGPLLNISVTSAEGSNLQVFVTG